MNSQNNDPSIAAAKAAENARSADAAHKVPAAGPGFNSAAISEATAIAAQDGRSEGKAQRLRAIEGAAGQQPQGVRGQGGANERGPGRQGSPAGQRQLKPEGFAPAVQPAPVGPLVPGRRDESRPEPVLARPPAAEARPRRRHFGILGLAFMLIVVPAITTSIYMWGFAVDQYVSTAGFAIRNQSASASPLDFLGAFGGGSSSTAKDTDILNNFIVSQQLVQKMQDEIDIRAIYSKPKNDPMFSYDTSGTIEDLVDYWNRMVKITYDNTSGLMQLNVYAFTPEDSQKVANAVLDESTILINKLAAVARDDTTKYAKQSLDDAKSKLRDARAAMMSFQIANNIVDPTSDVSRTSSVLTALNQQLVDAQVQLDLLKQNNNNSNDPRLAAINNKIDIIQNRIDIEKKASTEGDSTSVGHAEMLSQFQSLGADVEFAEKSYLAAQAGYDAAVEDAQHKQVYLAVYEEPTLAQAATAPIRWLILTMVIVVGFLLWSIIILVYYALRDRR